MWRWARRWTARQRLGRQVDVWYHPKYAPPAIEETARATTIDLHRGERILSALAHEGVLPPDRVRRPEPASTTDLARFHTHRYLESTNEPAWLGRVFGLDATAVDTDAVLQASLYATGGTIEACLDVWNRPGKVAFNLGGGYHHALADLGAGFCVHNDIAVALERIRANGFSGRVAMIDLDYHQGDGLLETYVDDPDVLVYSIHGSVWSHIESRHPQIHLTGRVGDRRYLQTLRTTLGGALRHHPPDLVFYVAGTDVLAGDALGSFQLTLQGVLDRDRFVLDALHMRRVPVVVMLAGGYSRDAWRAAYAMVRYALTGDARTGPAREPSLRERFEAIAAGLDPRELRLPKGSDPFQITDQDIAGSLFGPPRSDRFLQYYSPHGVELAFERYGLLDVLRARGFERVTTEFELEDSARQVVRIRGNRVGQPTVLLLELVVRRRWITDPAETGRTIEVLSIEWLLMQDPTRHFTLRRPPLPGQAHPGLGVSAQLIELLVQAVRRLELHGIVHRPAYFHTSFGGQGAFRFLDPEDEGRFQALKMVLLSPPEDVETGPVSSELFRTLIDEATLAIDDGRVQWGDGTTVQWQVGWQVLAVRPSLIEWFDGKTYNQQVTRARTATLRRGIRVDGA